MDIPQSSVQIETIYFVSTAPKPKLGRNETYDWDIKGSMRVIFKSEAVALPPKYLAYCAGIDVHEFTNCALL